MTKNDLNNLRYSPSQIDYKTKLIYDSIIEKSANIDCGNFRIIAVSDVALIFRLYDRYFFEGFFTDRLDGDLSFRISKRMTRAAGKLSLDRKQKYFTLTLSTFLIFQTFSDIEREISVNGIICRDRLEATMRVIEHETIHLLEYMLFGNSSCSNIRFKNLSAEIFGHKGVTHQLVTQWERAQVKFDLKVGDKVTFTFEDEIFKGVIYRITKRATIMVRNRKGTYYDSKGNRYQKYYIPLRALVKS